MDFPIKIAVNVQTVVDKIPKDTTEIHLIRPLKKKKLEEILNARHITKITLSQSCYNRLPPKTRRLLHEKNISISTERRRGRPISISLEKLREIIELRKDYQSVRKIEEITDVPKSTVHYLLKYADRGKVRKGGAIIYLK
jgi:hypothetical protein